MALYLVRHGPNARIEPELALALDRFELEDGLLLVDSALGLSPLYHRIKRALPPDTPLLVAPLAGRPKFKRMAPGALAWLRARQ